MRGGVLGGMDGLEDDGAGEVVEDELDGGGGRGHADGRDAGARRHAETQLAARQHGRGLHGGGGGDGEARARRGRGEGEAAGRFPARAEGEGDAR